MGAIGRNELCPCNSGKKFKNCHMRVFNPKERFQVKVTKGTIAKNVHYESSDGINLLEKPGRLDVRLEVEERNSMDPNEIDLLMKEFSEKIPEQENFLRERISRLRHKLNGIKYYLEKFRESENTEIKKFNTEYEGPSGQYVVSNPDLIYSLESFLFQVKSALDVLAQIIAISFNLGYVVTYAKEGKALIATLKQNSPTNLKTIAVDLTKILEKYQNWASNIIDMRDEVTHLSNLTGFSCFIRYPWMEGDHAEIAYPSMPDGNRAISYMDESWKILQNLIKDITPIIIASSKVSK